MRLAQLARAGGFGAAAHWRVGGPGCVAQRAAFSSHVSVVVPPLGDSISEGSISAVLKQAGDAVQENDVIAQIETDKVTIDIKAPQGGTLLGLLVKRDDVVTPGQPIATIDETAAAGGGALFGGATAKPPAAPAPAPGATAGAPRSGAEPAHGRRPGIRFPPRVTPDGQRISSLPAAEAEAWVRRLAGGAAGAGPTPAPTAQQAQERAPPQPRQPHASPVSPALAAVGMTAKAKVVTTRLKEQPARTRMTDREAEAIMLGGAID